jgi:ADP-heptose:LPS heptosyltransferase
MHGNGTITNALALAMGGRLTAGFYPPGGVCPDRLTFCPYPERQQEIRRHLRLLEFLGIPFDGEHLEFPMSPSDFGCLHAMTEAPGLKSQHYICLHAGGRAPERRWPTEHFAVVADALADKGFTIVLTGTLQEEAVAARVAARMQAEPVNLVGRTDLGSLGALLTRARLLVSNDTGTSHVAAALRIPSIIVCCGSDPVRWAPLDRRRHRVLLGDTATVHDVIRESEKLLGDMEGLAA